MIFLSNLSLKVKLVSLCAFLCLVSAVIVGVSFRGLHQVEHDYEFITDTVMPKLEGVNTMFTSFFRIRTVLRTLGLPGLSAEQQKEIVEETLSLLAAYEVEREKYVAQGFIEGQKAVYDEVQSAWLTFRGVGDRILAFQKSGTPEDIQAMQKAILVDCSEVAKKYEAAMTNLLGFHRGVSQNRSASAKALGQRTNLVVLSIGVIGVLLGLTLGTLFANSIVKSVSLVVENLTRSVEQVSSASTQIASSSEELSQATTQQAASLEETASSLEEITAMIAKASESANSASSSSNESQRKADAGRKAVDEMLTSMGEISQSNDAIMDQVSQSNQQMAEIVRVIQEIGTKTKVINEIVFQTKLLSFNASVEAARAGEHGKGFAVVAEEVGSLAQMSGNAAKEISDMLDSSISRVEKIVTDTKTGVSSLVDEGKRKVEAGVTVANQCSSLLNDIVQNVSLVSGLAQEIAVATKEQSQGVGEINKAIAQLDTVTQQNASNSQETATAAEQLSAQAETLTGVVTDLIATVHGAGVAANTRNTERTATRRKSHSSGSMQASVKVVPLKTAKKVHQAPKNDFEVKAASGGDHVPRRDDDGFRDI